MQNVIYDYFDHEVPVYICVTIVTQKESGRNVLARKCVCVDG